MSTMEIQQAAQCLEKLGNPTRLEIVRLLVRAGADGLSVGDIRRHTGVPASTLSHHLGLLEQAELVRSARRGRHVIYSCDLEGVRSLVRVLGEDLVSAEAGLDCAAE